ncbi:sugar ABC transporter permease [Streptomyces lavendofoliae]|uniref:carbohydrate ABC transporter permease n=1 Tax=Streptomyces lavendofoliae TaxID=67314 RepID=UPI00300F0959
MSKVEPREAFPDEPEPSEPDTTAGQGAAGRPAPPDGPPPAAGAAPGTLTGAAPHAVAGATAKSTPESAPDAVAGALPGPGAVTGGAPPGSPVRGAVGPGAAAGTVTTASSAAVTDPRRDTAGPAGGPPGGPAPAGGPPGRARGRGGRRPVRRREALVGLAFVAPMLVLFLVFRFGPTLGAAFLSLTDYRLSGEWTFIGAANYTRLLDDHLFWESLGVTAVYTALYVPMTVLLALGTAVLLHRTLWLRGFFRGLFFLPYVTSIVLAAVIWKWIYEVEDGLLNAALGVLGAGPVDFLGDDSLVLPSIAAATAWKGFGYSMLILLAGLQSIPREVVEAATIDGASAWQRFRWVTLPLLRPVLFFVLVIEAIQAFQVFDAMYVMTAGGPVRASYSLVYFLYDSGFKFFDFGYASAVGLVLFLIVLVFSLIQRRLIGREED